MYVRDFESQTGTVLPTWFDSQTVGVHCSMQRTVYLGADS